MERRDIDFLPTMIGILQKLHATSLERGQPNLAVLLDLARTEAEDALRTAGQKAELEAAFREAGASTH
jgi:hypothetical protein